MSAATLDPPCPKSAIAASPQPEVRRLSVTVNPSEVVISGRVSCFYLKQLAQETVKPTATGKRVVNRVEVAAL
jgi:BON domain